MKHSDILKEAEELFAEMSQLGDDVIDISAVRRMDYQVDDRDGTVSTARKDDDDTTIHGQSIAPESQGEYLVFDKFMDEIEAHEIAKSQILQSEARGFVESAAASINRLYRERWVNCVRYGDNK